MPYKPHENFKEPSDSTKVWRYMDFTKFVSILDSGCLFFARSDRLGDPFEGTYPLLNVSEREAWAKEAPDPLRDLFQSANDEREISHRLQRTHIAVNCWHMNDHESAAMWKLYLLASEGVAIQTTYGRLRDSIIDEQWVYFGQVEYIDYGTHRFEERSVFDSFLYKRMSFAHENEVRAVMWKPPIRDNAWDPSFVTIEHGCDVKVDVKTLVQQVYVAPTSPKWLSELVASVIRKYGFDFTVNPSGLDESPLF